MDIGLERRREGSGVRVPMGCSGRTAQPDLVTVGTIDMGRVWERRAAAVRIILREARSRQHSQSRSIIQYWDDF